MKLCADCKQNLCDDCYENDCDCNLSSHTLSAALILKCGAEMAEAFLTGEQTPIVQTGDITIQILTKDNDQSEFNLLINDRTYHVTVRA